MIQIDLLDINNTVSEIKNTWKKLQPEEKWQIIPLYGIKFHHYPR